MKNIISFEESPRSSLVIQKDTASKYIIHRKSHTYSPTAEKCFVKVLGNQKIPALQCRTVIYSHLRISTIVPSHRRWKNFKTKTGESFGYSAADNDSFCDHYEDLINPIIEESCRINAMTPNVLRSDLVSQHKQKEEAKPKPKQDLCFQPCGRFYRKRILHSKDLLPQTKAKIQSSKPLLIAKLRVSGTQNFENFAK